MFCSWDEGMFPDGFELHLFIPKQYVHHVFLCVIICYYMLLFVIICYYFVFMISYVIICFYMFLYFLIFFHFFLCFSILVSAVMSYPLMSYHSSMNEFDMRQRQLFATLPKSALLATVLPHLQQHVQDYGLHQAMDIAEIVERELFFQLPKEDSIMASTWRASRKCWKECLSLLRGIGLQTNPSSLPKTDSRSRDLLRDHLSR